MLTASHVVLKPLMAADLPRLFDWINDREQVLFNAAYRPISEENHRAWFEAVQDRPDIVIFGIHLIGRDQMIGSCQLRGIDPVHRTAELQIRVGEVDERGRGYGTEAIRLLLDFAFRDLNLHRVHLQVFATNMAAIRAYEKVGFHSEGVMREAAHIDGAYVDVLIMGILRDEYAGT